MSLRSSVVNSNKKQQVEDPTKKVNTQKRTEQVVGKQSRVNFLLAGTEELKWN